MSACKSQAHVNRRDCPTLLLLVWFGFAGRWERRALSFLPGTRSPVPVSSDHIVYLKEAARCGRRLDCDHDKSDLSLQ